MNFIADLHLHGKYSRGCSKDLTLETLEQYGKMKGLDLLGTGDFCQPDWYKHLKKNLSDDGTGLYRSKTGYPFVLQNEFSLVYTQDGKGRRVHLVFLAPDLDCASQITEEMLKVGRVDYDGRPIFKMSCIEFTEKMMDISKKIEIFPAHIWTPWFSMLGAKSGFDTMKDCFGDQLKNIHAVETGLSSDPQMNWRLKQLDKMTILSTSDSHSYWPWRIGREATVLDMKPNYSSLVKAIRNNKVVETIEVDPNYGKYHFDGHRKCGVVITPEEARKHSNLCPVCEKPLTMGVMQRIEELADRPEDYYDKKRPGFRTMVPLHEVISNVVGKGVSTKTVWKEYDSLMKSGKNEFDVMMNVDEKDLLKVTSKEICKAVLMNRVGDVRVRPGYDGVYGEPVFDKKEKIIFKTYPKVVPKQRGLGDFV